MARVEMDYPRLLEAVGKVISSKNMSDVCIMEFEDGLIVSGSVVVEGRTGIKHRIETIVLSRQELGTLLAPPPKRGLFSR
jgi:hypothetical protein